MTFLNLSYIHTRTFADREQINNNNSNGKNNNKKLFLLQF